MGVFKYTYKKLLFSKSTFFITLILLIFLAFGTISISEQFKWTYFLQEFLRKMHFTISDSYYNFVILIFLPIFIGVKAISFIADEINDGSLLVILAKPISRSQILIEKFIAYEFVILSWILGVLFAQYALILQVLPFKIVFNYFIVTAWSTFFISVLIQLFLSIFIITLSLKINRFVCVGIVVFFGFAIGVVNTFVPALIIRNRPYQQNLNTEISKESKDVVLKGQGLYEWLKYVDIAMHIKQMYYSGFENYYRTYDLKNLKLSMLNKRVIFTDREVIKTNKAGKKVTTNVEKISGYSLWLSTSFLYIFYWIISLLLLFWGFYYFKNKDIV